MNKYEISNLLDLEKDELIKELQPLIVFNNNLTSYNSIKRYLTNSYTITNPFLFYNTIPRDSIFKDDSMNIVFNYENEYIPIHNLLNIFFNIDDSKITKINIKNMFNLINFYSNIFTKSRNIFNNNYYSSVNGFKKLIAYNYYDVRQLHDLNTVYGKYRGNTYVIYHKEKNKILFMFVIKKEYSDYVKKCLLLKIDIDIRVFELWVDDEFDITNSYFKNIRPHYRKFIKKPFLEAGGKVVIKNNIIDNYIKTFYLKDNCSNVLELMKNKKLLKESIIKIK